jgi:hypothetical protein
MDRTLALPGPQYHISLLFASGPRLGGGLWRKEINQERIKARGIICKTGSLAGVRQRWDSTEVWRDAISWST